jgi:hypothetical protein
MARAAMGAGRRRQSLDALRDLNQMRYDALRDPEGDEIEMVACAELRFQNRPRERCHRLRAIG